MELKKNPKADLEKSRSIFLQIGFLFVLSIVFIAFEWTSSDEQTNSLGELGDIEIEEEIIPITRQQDTPPPPPPPKAIAEEILIVENDTEIEEELEIEDTEADEDTEIEIVVEEEEESDEVFMFAVIEDKPQFPGGDRALLTFLGTETKYPPIAKNEEIQGKVYVGFVIDKDGSVKDVSILRGVHPLLDNEAKRVVAKMPKWTPGKQRGKAVKVSYMVPINFKLY